jgi:hypothetical protein
MNFGYKKDHLYESDLENQEIFVNLEGNSE